jgi:hypothetical protein
MKVVRSSASRTGRPYPQECSLYSFSLGTASKYMNIKIKGNNQQNSTTCTIYTQKTHFSLILFMHLDGSQVYRVTIQMIFEILEINCVKCKLHVAIRSMCNTENVTKFHGRLSDSNVTDRTAPFRPHDSVRILKLRPSSLIRNMHTD